MLDDLSYRMGSLLGGFDAQLRGGGAGAPGHDSHSERPGAEPGSVEDGPDHPDHSAADFLTAGLGGMVVARLLRPHPVNWTRVIVAGVAATVLADLVGRIANERSEPGEEPFATEPEEIMARIGAGLAMAAGYAALLYPRLPGPPLLRGLAFGALEMAAAPRGGLIRLASETPGVKFPLQALALPIDEDAGPLSHLAYGVGLGLFYRYDPDGGEDSDDEDA